MADTTVSFVFIGALAGALVVGVTLARVNHTVASRVAAYVKAEITEAGGTYEDVAYDSASDTVTVTGLAVPAKSAEGADLKIALLALTGTDPDALEAVARPDADAPPRAEPVKEPLTLFGRVAASDLVVTEATGETLKIQNVEWSDVRLLPLAPRAPEPSGQPGAEARATTDTGAPPRDTADLEALEVMTKLTFESLSLEGLEAASPTSSDRLAFKSLTVEDYDFGDIGPIALAGLEGAFEGGSARLTLAEARIASVKLEEYLAEFYRLASSDAPLEPARNLTSEFGNSEIKTFALALPEGTVTLDQLLVSDMEYKDGFNTKSRVRMTGLVVPLTLIEDAYFRDLGYSAFRVNLNALSAFDPDAGTLSVPEFYFELTEMGALDLTLEMTGFEFLETLRTMTAEEAEALGPNALGEMALGGKLKYARVSYRDLSLVDHLMTRAATEAGLERPELIGAWLTEFEASANQSGLYHPFVGEMKTALFTFLLAPRTITLTAAPAEPVALLSAAETADQDPSAALEALGLTVSANE